MVTALQFALSNLDGPIMNKKAPKKNPKPPLFQPLTVRKILWH